MTKHKIQITNIKTFVLKFLIGFLILFCYLNFDICHSILYAQVKSEPIIVNGDTVEYFTEKNEVVASGNVAITYKGTKLTCDKITVNTQTKEATAEGNAKLEDERGLIEGQKIVYNFNTKSGLIVETNYRANPYFGRAKKVEKISDKEFIAYQGYMTTCNYDQPHYHFLAKKIDFFPKDKVQAKGLSLWVGKLPLLFIPQYTHSFQDPLMHVQISPGSRKEWGPYLLTAWRYNLNENSRGRIYLDYRNKLGLAEGIGLNYNTQRFGQGDFKFYYTEERPEDRPENSPKDFERYFIRLRHKWEISLRTNLISEYYKIEDEKRKKLGNEHNFLKTYFYREYEKDSQPRSYVLLNHQFNYSSLSLLMQARTNPWFDQIEKLPQLQYIFPSRQIGNTPFYFEHNSSFANFNKKASTFPLTEQDVKVSRFDMTNRISLPFKALFLEITPYVAGRETIYDKGLNGESLPKRTIFYTGANLSTKFYRIFNVNSNFLGMKINGLRHIITPIVGYSYNHEPTKPASVLKQIDDIDSLSRREVINLELSNKLQTKRNNQSVDLLDARARTSYILNPKDGSGSHFSDLLFDLDLRPYAWLRASLNTTYDNQIDKFREINISLYADLGKERSFGIGQRYYRKGGNELTSQFTWRFNPKWKFKMYHRYQFAESRDKGLKEQEYTISRDLHCWEMDFSYNIEKSRGHTLWFVFRLKAFPELEFGFEQSYHEPRSGSETNP